MVTSINPRLEETGLRVGNKNHGTKPVLWLAFAERLPCSQRALSSHEFQFLVSQYISAVSEFVTVFECPDHPSNLRPNGEHISPGFCKAYEQALVPNRGYNVKPLLDSRRRWWDNYAHRRRIP